MRSKLQRLLLCFAAVATFCFPVMVLSGCFSTPVSDSDETTDLPTVQDTQATLSETDTSSDVVEIKTDYGTMSYPIGFEEIVSFEEVDSDGAQSFVFSAVLNEEHIKVYTISFSQTDRDDLGELLGTIQGGDGGVANVYFAPPEDDIVNENMSEDDQNLVYAAQETVNDVIASLKDNDAFEEAR